MFPVTQMQKNWSGREEGWRLAERFEWGESWGGEGQEEKERRKEGEEGRSDEPWRGGR